VKDIKGIESVQRRLSGMSNLTYSERLASLDRTWKSRTS